jgi:hypothetical protein
VTMQVDGDSESSLSGRWSSFIGVSKAHACLGQKAADSVYAAKAKDVGTDIWLFLSVYDRTLDTDNMRLFPFDTSGSTNSGAQGTTKTDLFVRNYGSALKTAATFTATIAKANFSSEHSLKGAKKMKFELEDAKNKDIKSDSTSKTGYVVMKYTAGTWGGTCCATYDTCADWGEKVD